MVKDLYQKSFSVLMKRPFRLWGLSLLAGVLLLAAQGGFLIDQDKIPVFTLAQHF